MMGKAPWYKQTNEVVRSEENNGLKLAREISASFFNIYIDGVENEVYSMTQGK